MNEWISCDDRLPDKDGRYLVCEDYSNGGKYPNSKWIGVSSLRDGKFDGIMITHWMPLPPTPTDELIGHVCKKSDMGVV